MTEKKVRCEIERQKMPKVALELYVNGDPVTKDGMSLSVSEELSGGCRLGKMELTIENKELSECCNLKAQMPVRLFLPMSEMPTDITALYMFSSWWSRPAFVRSLKEIPDKTQVALFRFADRYGCFVPMVGERFKAYLTQGTDTQLQLVLTALYAGVSELHEPLYLYVEAQSVSEAISTVFTELARIKNIRMREQRRVPQIFRRLGWCSWDAFYTDVDEKGIRAKAAEFAEKQVPVKWMIIDDGWLDLKDRLLYDYRPDRDKFPEGFRRMTEEIRNSTGVEWFGVWHALMGYWSGISPDSPVAREEREYLCHTASGRLVPDPEHGAGFYRDWYRVLNEQGISFVKVDGQGTIPLCFENTVPLGTAARGLHSALESGAARMDGAVINCMGMAMENILSRPATAISRNSDDFFPGREGSFYEHLLQNAYNSLYHDQLYCCDWDMFWTEHPDSAKHALLRAISGGPVYCSDRVGQTDPAVLKPLVYKNGDLMMMDRSPKPTADCVFTDPMHSGYLKLQNTAPYGKNLTGGGIAIYNLSEREISCTFAPSQVEGITVCDKYVIYDHFEKTVRAAGYDELIECTVKGGGYRWLIILPVKGDSVCLGLTEKYVGFTAVESIHDTADMQTVVLHESGTSAWVSECDPKRITVDGEDVTAKAVRDGVLIMVPLEEKAGQTVAVIEFDTKGGREYE